MGNRLIVVLKEYGGDGFDSKFLEDLDAAVTFEFPLRHFNIAAEDRVALTPILLKLHDILGVVGSANEIRPLHTRLPRRDLINKPVAGRVAVALRVRPHEHAHFMASGGEAQGKINVGRDGVDQQNFHRIPLYKRPGGTPRATTHCPILPPCLPFIRAQPPSLVICVKY